MATKRKRPMVSAPEDFPDFGAIFMANRATMKECLKRRLFGLPSSQQGFVRGVRAGMVLFLFEYEERLLYGVFEATSNGGFDVVPRAYGSRFPAQVRFSKIWDCDPLGEDEFRDAIEENYYERFKFRFGLSRSQVKSLLLLLDTKRTEVSTVRSLSCKREYPSGIGSGDTETERLAFWRIPSSGKSIVDCKHPKISPSDQTVKDKARGSLFSGESGNSISSFESESGPYDFGAGIGATISKEEPENLKDSAKDIGGDLEDFIPLPSPDNSENEMEYSENNQTESIAFEQYFPMKLISSEDSEKKGNRSSLQVDNSLKLNVSDNRGDCLRIKGLYSDDQENRSVFSRLKFGSKDIAQENRKSTKKDRLVRESRGNTQHRHGNKETTVFSHLSLTSKVMQDINDTVRLQIGSGQHSKTMEETKFAREDGEGYSEMRSLAYECKGHKKEEKTSGSDLVQDIMGTLLQKHKAWRKIDTGRKAFEQEDVNPREKKNVFSRLSWASESIHLNTVVTMRLQKGNGMGMKRVSSAGFCPQYRNCKYRWNNFADRWPETLPQKKTRESEVLNQKYNNFADKWPETLSWKKTRESGVPNQKYEAEENFDTSAHISKMSKGETQTDEGEYANDSESKCKSEQPRRKLVRPFFNQSSEVKTHTHDSCLNVQILSSESSVYKENSGSSEASAKGIIADEKVASLEKEAVNVLDPLHFKGDKGEADCKFVSNESNSGELLVGGFNPAGRTVTTSTTPLKTYKRRAKKI